MTTNRDLLEAYRKLPDAQRLEIARQASPDLRAQLLAVEREIAMDRSPGSMAAVLTNGKEMQARHLDLVDHAFQRIAAGERVKVMLTMPPRHGKSRRASRWAPVWYLRRNPDHRLMLASYSATLADDHGRWIRDTITGYADVLGISLNPSSHAANRFDIAGHEGGMVTAGVGGGLTGKGANCFPDETLVTTENGRIPLSDLVAMEQPPRVLSFNHSTGRTQWCRILATRTTTADGLIEVTTSRGHTVRATGDHPFYVPGSGYRPAEALRPGDRLSTHCVSHEQALHPVRQGQGQAKGNVGAILQGLLQPSPLCEGASSLPVVRGTVREAEVRIQQGDPARPLLLLLLQAALAGSSRCEERTAVRALRHPNARKTRKQILRQAMHSRFEELSGEGVHHMRPLLSTKEQPNHVLRASLRGQSPLHQDARDGKQSLQGRHQLQQVVQGDQAPDLRAGQGFLRRLLQALRADHVRTRRPDRSALQPAGSPPRRGPGEQPSRKPHTALLQLPPRPPQVHGDSVSVVRRVHAPGVRVHDIQVEGNSNFFADGVLVHNCLIVDDPFKGSDDAESQTQRDRVWDWWQSVALTRLEPNGSLVVINTRWNPDDLSGRLLESEGDEWTVLDLPAIAMAEDDPLQRTSGEALWPERYNIDDLARIRKGVGERVWWALYQQQPRPLEGGAWKWPWITDNRITPMQFRGIDLTRTLVAVDQAGGAGSTHDETGVIGAGRVADGNLYVLADRSANMGADTWGHVACRLAIELQADAFVVEDNFGGDQSAQILRQAWRDLERNGETNGLLMPRIIPVHAKQGKKLRAEPIAQLAAQGLVHHVGEFPQLESQLVTWLPGMDSPDRMDAYVHALTELADPAQEGLGTQHYTDQRLRGRR